jgi:hypothetical protein
LARPSAAALWSRLRGRREEGLARGRAGLERARADLAGAEERVATLRAAVDRLVEQSEHLADADRREQSALEDLASGGLAWDGQDAGQVAEARAEVDRRRTVRELDLALATGAGMLRSLELVRSLSASLHRSAWLDAKDVSGSWVKYQKLAELVPHLQSVNEGLRGFAAQAGPFGTLATAQLPLFTAPQIDRRVRLADEWLDDPVTDLLVTAESRQVLDDARIALGVVEQAVATLRRQRELIPTG